ncbi:MAG: hypothetical protein IJO48_07380 [Clostridia bacterium]|nr:hypothetical protein [Clostridia bacterium]
MQLLMFITNDVNSVSPILSELMEKGIGGATVTDCKGMLTALNESSVEPPPIFGSLRKFINPERESGKMIFMVVEDSELEAVKDVIHDVCGNLSRPNSGIMFAIPLMWVEGVPRT